MKARQLLEAQVTWVRCQEGNIGYVRPPDGRYQIWSKPRFRLQTVHSSELGSVLSDMKNALGGEVNTRYQPQRW